MMESFERSSTIPYICAIGLDSHSRAHSFHPTAMSRSCQLLVHFLHATDYKPGHFFKFLSTFNEQRLVPRARARR